MSIQNCDNKSIKVIVADDSEYLRKSISKILSNHKSIEIVEFATNGKEAVNLVKIHRPDVLILDLIMPEMNGLDAFKQIINHNPTPTIILSAVNPQNMDTSIQALIMGAFDYIIKPGGLGAKNLPRFKEELLTKVLLASQSQIKRIFKKEKDRNKKSYLRQELIDQTFKFGQYLNKLEPIEEIEDEKPTSPIVDLTPKKNAIGLSNSNKQNVEFTNEIILKNIRKSKGKIKKNKLIELILKSKIKQKETSTIAIKSNLRSNKYVNLKKGNTLNKKNFTPIKNIHISSKVIVIGASVGGPRTLKSLLMKIPTNISCPILVVQHLNDPFVDSFINNLNEVCNIKIKVGVDGEYLQSGIIYFAPGGQHMAIIVKNNKPCIRIFKDEPVHFCIPSIDILFFSAAKIYQKKTMGILLTGMGEDGVDGLEAIKNNGGETIAESEETAVLYGMPKSAIQRNLAKYILPNYKIKDYIIQFYENKKLK